MSCYKFAPGIDPHTFIFPTDYGWLYSVSFPGKSTLFDGNEILQNEGLSFEILFDRSPLDEVTKGKDPFVQATIQTILNNQFELQGVLPIYFFWCDMKDRQEGARAKLFNQWFQSCESPGWELFNFELKNPDEEGYTYYAGLFVHSDHPNIALLPDAFEQFLQEDISTGKLVSRR
jgi:hypothetical protein